MTDEIVYDSVLYVHFLGANEDGFLSEPMRLPLFDRYVIVDVALGARHSLFLTDSGLFSSGCNECGQLGHSKADEMPGNDPIIKYVHGYSTIYMIFCATQEQ